MDYVMKAKDLKAMKYYSSCYKDIQVVIYNLIFSSLVALTCSFLCSYSFWFSSLKYFAFISLPSFWSSFLNPKLLFVVFNVIVVYLVGESKLLGSPSPSPANEIYSEYVERTRNLRRQKKYSHEEEKNLETSTSGNECVEEQVYEEKEVMVVEQQNNDDQEKTEDQDEEDFQEAENDYEDGDGDGDGEKREEEEVAGEEVKPIEFPAEELNRRVEEFIARINKQRWIEAKQER